MRDIQKEMEDMKKVCDESKNFSEEEILAFLNSISEKDDVYRADISDSFRLAVVKYARKNRFFKK